MIEKIKNVLNEIGVVERIDYNIILKKSAKTNLNKIRQIITDLDNSSDIVDLDDRYMVVLSNEKAYIEAKQKLRDYIRRNPGGSLRCYVTLDFNGELFIDIFDDGKYKFYGEKYKRKVGRILKQMGLRRK